MSDEAHDDEEVSIAPNYRDGFIWISVGARPRRPLQPDHARQMADRMDEEFGSDVPDPEDEEAVTDLSDKLRELADDVESAAGGE